jgi:hypothetical protein
MELVKATFAQVSYLEGRMMLSEMIALEENQT